VSNAVSAFRPPEGLNARRVLVTEGIILGTLVAGISWLAHVTHAAPFRDGVPTVLSQEAQIVFGSSIIGHWAWILVQAATALILYTGGNTSFNGFPFLASFVAEDAFLPRWLTKRGHRLVFSNGIIVLAVLSSILLAVAGANVNNLVPFYALGVFTAFTMAGFGMAKYHHRMQEPGWRHKLVINFSAGVTSLIVVLIFAVVKFKEGAWLVLIVFAIMVPVLIRLNREYRMEASVLEGIGTRRQLPAPPTYPRRTVFLFVDSFDLATLAALRYARSLRPTTLRAVHFVIDSAEAETLRQEWLRAKTSVVLDFIDCPDRRLTRAAAELVNAEAALPGVGVTAILPRRGYSPLLGRLLHDRTADKIAGVVSRIPHAVATIVPFDVRSRLEALHGRPGGDDDHPLKAVPADGAAPSGPAGKPAEGTKVPEPGPATVSAAAEPRQVREPSDPGAGQDFAAPAGATAAIERAGEDAIEAMEEVGGTIAPSGGAPTAKTGREAADGGAYERPVPPAGVRPMGSLDAPGRATVEGRVYAVEIRPVEQNTVLAAELADSTGQLTALFYGRSHIPGLDCGARVRLRGQVGIRDGGPVMINPAYELLPQGQSQQEPPPGEEPPGGTEPRGRKRP
jgi:hypothetical protein